MNGPAFDGNVLALAGGVGGAKLAAGLAAALPPERLTIVVNTGDDFEHLGLCISPDLDSVMYALAGANDPVRGWGLSGESWNMMDALKRLGGPDWFALGDRDLATHLLRTQALRERTLSQATAELARAFGIAHRLVPMSDDPVRSLVHTDEGALAFQDYFVRRRCEPRFAGIAFDGIEAAKPSPGFLAALDDPQLSAIVLCPSNPILSLAPLLALPGIAERLRQRRAPLAAVSPFVEGAAVKGPAAKMLREIGLAPTPEGLLACYEDGLIDGLIVDRSDAEFAARSGRVAVLATETLMRDAADRTRLARETLAFAATLRAAREAA